VSRNRNSLLGGEQSGFADLQQSVNSHSPLYQAATNWFVWLIWFVLFIWLVSFNQKTRKTKQIK
jgi:hypothetical protein